MSKIKMPKEFRKRWLTALRSGRYKQTSGELHSNDNGNCCLGVAGRVLRVRKENLNAVGMPADLDEKDRLKFPACLVRRGKDTKFAEDLARLNDRDTSFKEISDYIEKKTIAV